MFHDVLDYRIYQQPAGDNSQLLLLHLPCNKILLCRFYRPHPANTQIPYCLEDAVLNRVSYAGIRSYLYHVKFGVYFALSPGAMFKEVVLGDRVSEQAAADYIYFTGG